MHAPPEFMQPPRWLTARRDVAVHDRPPAADLDEALVAPELLGVRALLVVRAADAVAVHRLAEEPGRPAELVELGQRSEPLQEVEDRGDGLGEGVANRRTTEHVHDRHPEGASVILSEE